MTRWRPGRARLGAKAVRPGLAALPLLAATLATAAACGPSAEALEARRVVSLIDRMRKTPPEQRAPLIAKLEQEPARGEAAKRARDRCAAAYRALDDGTKLESKVRRQLALPSPPATALEDLTRAEAEIRKATEAMPRCNEALAAARRIGR
ncbi:MAG: hypothetical protein JRI23_30370 [Deltaproteobacteria bacterium]|jgi:hypothetical protein|nr:hypothetical protein [Deltaproteobacteria bacterium]MBW2536479.1 hypothetical protein [Deltaproteobacteria bacterium]